MSTQTLPTPNPKVYRLAAKIVTEARQYDGTLYTCLAIVRAYQHMQIPPASGNMYVQQYQAVFGPYIPGTVAIKTDHRRSAYCHGTRIPDLSDHPFWNLSLPKRPFEDQSPSKQAYTIRLQNTRVLALLFMADIVEQGGFS